MATIKRRNKLIKLTDDEVEKIYKERRIQIMVDWMTTLLEQYGFPEQDAETLRDMAENFMDRMQNGDKLGEVEHETFKTMMEFDYPEIESEDE